MDGTNYDPGKSQWELYDLEADPGEIHDLAKEYPEKIKELLTFWEQWCIQTGTVWGPERFEGEYERRS
jgi:arylsulfatase